MILAPDRSPHSPGPLQGLHLGTVLDSADPEQRGRLQVRLHATGLDAWAAVMVAGAGPGYGVSLLPRTGEQVIVAFVGPDLPIVLGALWSGSDRHPEVARPVDARYVLRSPSGLQVQMDDDAAQVRIETPAGRHLTLTDSGTGTVTLERDGDTVELSASGIKVSTALQVEVEAAQVTVSAGLVTVDAGMSRFSGVVQCDTLISNAVVSASYSPGAGNLW